MKLGILTSVMATYDHLVVVCCVGLLLGAVQATSLYDRFGKSPLIALGARGMQGAHDSFNLMAGGQSLAKSNWVTQRAPPTRTCSLLENGAVGDGVADDTAAVQRAFDACKDGGEVLIDEGAYLILDTIRVLGPIDIRGSGERAVFLWAVARDLFFWGNSVDMVVIGDFTVASVRAAKSNLTAAFRFSSGITKSTLQNILFIGQGPVLAAGVMVDTVLLGTCLHLGPVTDTVEIRGCLVWFTAGTGIAIGRGSEVRVEGGRIIGPDVRNDSSIGIHVRGNNGGVHVVATDVIALHIGMLLEDDLGVGSNRFVAPAPPPGSP